MLAVVNQNRRGADRVLKKQCLDKKIPGAVTFNGAFAAGFITESGTLIVCTSTSGDHVSGLRVVNIVFAQEDFEALKKIKGYRTWREFVMQLLRSETTG